ncbi:septal ring factor EnvC (AmiA/AmiB activator) [Pseudomonas hunanensis]|uniref:Septal ring factor EnvC (AmiA/AmiB activator) n=1 Tax=Pseudomonas hunanensis TaxID=1247546 RepID=A0ACC6K4F1_9PSED|nr:translation initiation factor 2 [Pseudomonas hunanensis]MDR6713290.1 septal ring factor EnvC (AmiA/AmiB activator) [Pseudomonas hunanensis]
MRQGPLSLLLCLLLLSPLACANNALSLESGARTTELQQRLEESDKQRASLAEQLTRLRQDNQRLALSIKQMQANTPQSPITDQQLWFLIGSGVALFSVLCGIFASGGHRRRRQWLN